MAKVSLAEFTDWIALGYDQNMRFGQAFINRFYDQLRDRMPDPEVFYMENNMEAYNLVLLRYVEVKNE